MSTQGRRNCYLHQLWCPRSARPCKLPSRCPAAAAVEGGGNAPPPAPQPLRLPVFCSPPPTPPPQQGLQTLQLCALTAPPSTARPNLLRDADGSGNSRICRTPRTPTAPWTPARKICKIGEGAAKPPVQERRTSCDLRCMAMDMTMAMAVPRLWLWL